MKKRMIITSIFLLALAPVFAQNKLVPVIDERFELMSIVAHFSSVNGYEQIDIHTYSKAVDDYFAPFKNDELIKFTKEIPIAFDAVASMAVHLQLVQGKFRFKDNLQKTSLDQRWKEHSNKFISLLNEFYIKTDFHKFFTQNKALYSVAEQRFTEVVNEIDAPWFERFFGERTNGTYNIIIGMATNGNNYGPAVNFLNGGKEVYSIVGAWQTDSLGLPLFEKERYVQLIIHEFSHSFCNHLIDKHYSEMKKAAKHFYNFVDNKMCEQHYSSAEMMMYETMVRASTLRYLKEHNSDENKLIRMVAYEQMNGFVLIKQFLSLFEKYQETRPKYPTLDSYMSEIIGMLNSLNPKKTYDESICHGTAEIVSISIKNGSTTVDPATKELTFVFDRPMSGSMGFYHGRSDYPKTKSVKWNADKTQLTFSIDLKPDTKYAMVLHGEETLDEHFCSMKEKQITFTFQTGK